MANLRVSYSGLLYQPSKLRMWVRFPSPALEIQGSSPWGVFGNWQKIIDGFEGAAMSKREAMRLPIIELITPVKLLKVSYRLVNIEIIIFCHSERT